MQLNNEEMLNCVGGEFSFTLAAVITAAVTFIAGIVDGIVRPVKCH